jgi:hypothetical protein
MAQDAGAAPPSADAGAGTQTPDAGAVTPPADAGTTLPPDAGASNPPAADAGSGGSLTASGTGLLPSTPSGWSAFSARSETAAATTVSAGPNGYVLNIAGAGLPTVYGGWTTHVGALPGSAWYRFTARAHPTAIASLRESITIVLRWTGVPEQVSPDYVWNFDLQADGSILFDRTI